MPNTLWAVVRENRIELLDNTDIPEGSKVLVTVLGDNEPHSLQNSSQTALDTIWNNSEDDVYAKLLEK